MRPESLLAADDFCALRAAQAQPEAQPEAAGAAGGEDAGAAARARAQPAQPRWLLSRLLRRAQPALALEAWTSHARLLPWSRGRGTADPARSAFSGPSVSPAPPSPSLPPAPSPGCHRLVAPRLAPGQTEKSYQKQPRVSFAYKTINAKNLSAKDLRYTRAVGLGFKTPATAIKVSSMRGG